MEWFDWLKFGVALVGGGWAFTKASLSYVDKKIDGISLDIQEKTSKLILIERETINDKLANLSSNVDEEISRRYSDVNARIDKLQSETNELLKKVEVDMALLKYKSEVTGEYLKKIDSKIENIQVNVGAITMTIQKLIYKTKDAED